jgi:hypothetical protein
MNFLFGNISRRRWHVMRQQAAILAVLLGAVLLAAASTSPAQPPRASELRCIPVEEALRPFGPPTTQDPRHIAWVGAKEAPLFYSASVPEEIIETGRPVDFTLTIRNSGGTPATFSFSTAQRYDVVVWNDDCVEVWRWSRGRAFAQVLTSLSVPTGGTTRYHVLWDQRDQRGQPVRIGAYEARVVFLGKWANRNTLFVLPPLVFAVR